MHTYVHTYIQTAYFRASSLERLSHRRTVFAWQYCAWHQTAAHQTRPLHQCSGLQAAEWDVDQCNTQNTHSDTSVHMYVRIRVDIHHLQITAHTIYVICTPCLCTHMFMNGCAITDFHRLVGYQRCHISRTHRSTYLQTNHKCRLIILCLMKPMMGETLHWSDNWKWQVICWRAWSSKITILLPTPARLTFLPNHKCSGTQRSYAAYIHIHTYTYACYIRMYVYS